MFLHIVAVFMFLQRHRGLTAFRPNKLFVFFAYAKMDLTARKPKTADFITAL